MQGMNEGVTQGSFADGSLLVGITRRRLARVVFPPHAAIGVQRRRGYGSTTLPPRPVAESRGSSVARMRGVCFTSSVATNKSHFAKHDADF
jgi:hypothetical protein